jgi:hypothetical protein
MKNTSTQWHQSDDHYRSIQEKSASHSNLISKRARFDQLPVELIRIILLFFAKDFRDLIKFSTLNQTCKFASDHSLLWMTSDLTFYSPKAYTKLLLGISGDDYPIEGMILNMHSASTNYFLSDSYRPVIKVMFNRLKAVFYENRPLQERYEVSNHVRVWFMDYYINYHKLWRFHIRWRPVFNNFYLYYRLLDQNMYNILGCFFALLCICLYLFSDGFPRTSFSTNNQVGFALIYFILGSIQFINFLSLLATYFAYYFCNLHSLKPGFSYRPLFGIDLIGIFNFLFFITILLTQLKLMNEITWSWRCITIPMWILSTLGLILLSFGFSVMDYSWNQRFYGIIAYIYIVYSIVLSVFLLAWESDTSNSSINIGNALIPIYPMLLVLFLVTLVKLFMTITGSIFGCDDRPSYLSVFFKKMYRDDCRLVFLVILHRTLEWISTGLLIIASFSVIFLLIEGYEVDNYRGMSKEIFGITFTPIVLLFLIIDGIFGGLIFHHIGEKVSIHTKPSTLLPFSVTLN